MSPTKSLYNWVTETFCPGFYWVINLCVDVCYMCVPLKCNVPFSMDTAWYAGYFTSYFIEKTLVYKKRGM